MFIIKGSKNSSNILAFQICKMGLFKDQYYNIFNLSIAFPNEKLYL